MHPCPAHPDLSQLTETDKHTKARPVQQSINCLSKWDLFLARNEHDGAMELALHQATGAYSSALEK